MKVLNFLYRKKWFWRLNNAIERDLSFKAFRWGYRVRHEWWQQKRSYRLLRSFLPRFILQLLYAGVVVLVFEWLNLVLPLPKSFTIDYEVARPLIGTIVTVVGIFLGLYFTAVSAIAGGLLMRATEDLQQVFLREATGRDYITTLGMTVVLGVYYLALAAVKYPFSPYGILAIVLLVVYGVIRFIVLGFRTFYFLHPIQACTTITSDAGFAIENATAKGFGWRKNYLQDHYKKQAIRSVGTLRSLIRFGVDAIKVSDEQLIEIVQYTHGLLQYYLDKKKQIPTEGQWYRGKPKFEQWIFASESALVTALNTNDRRNRLVER
jgi:hypothetical protein